MTAATDRRPRTPQQETMPLGVVLCRAPGVTRWAGWTWRVTDLLPGAGPTDGTPLRTEGELSWIHAATRTVELHVSDSEAYVHELQSREPSLYVILRADPAAPASAPRVVTVTASPYEAQDYADNGEDIVERIAMPAPVRAWVEAFVARHHVEVPFKKRRRDRLHEEPSQDGIGDARIAQDADVYRTPETRRRVPS